MLVFNGCDYIVLEAGLGGEYDATAVFPKALTLVTPIAYDHESFLGDTIEKIATTKLNAIQKKAILGKQKFQAVYEVAEKLAHQKELSIYDVEDFITNEDDENIEIISANLSLVKYLQENLRLSIACLNLLKIGYSPTDFANAKLFGRMTKIRKNILLDVGHNPLAAESLVDVLKGETYVLIYNTYKDKEYKKILQILQPIIKYVAILAVQNQRIESIEQLQKTLTELEIKYEAFQNVKENEKYLVFGSFSVAEEFLRVLSE
jgi:dihydrofolate synthase/folylpolyglutamate synthase